MRIYFCITIKKYLCAKSIHQGPLNALTHQDPIHYLAIGHTKGPVIIHRISGN